MRLTWIQPEDLLPHELIQCRAEHLPVDDIAARWTAAGGSLVAPTSGAGPELADPALRALARHLLEQLAAMRAAAPVPPGLPDAWADIEALLPPPPTLPAPVRALLVQRVRGAWTGRAVGCLLGKPVEKIPRQGIEEILRATGRWPLDRYFTAVGLPHDVATRWPWNRRSAPTSLEENIDGMPEDDDLNYPLLALDLLERHGLGFTTDDVAELWLAALPAGRVFTAERAAYRNLLDARAVPETATHLNPFREWIGALIRADVLGWVVPGDTHGAARLAHRDARLSHTREGIYGAQWAAALCSAALVADDVEQALDAAASSIPPASRLAHAVSAGRDLGHASRDLTASLDALHARYGHLHWVHVLNNAATVAWALTVGAGDFDTAISAAVSAGWDTDSAGATVGSVAGALAGPQGIDRRWTDPIGGRITTSLPGPGTHTIDELVARTCALQDRFAATNAGTSTEVGP